MPEGGVGVGGRDIAGGAEELANVLGEIPAVGIPGAADLDSQRAGGYGLGRVPGEQPQAGVMTTGEIHASNLQVAAVEITMVECHAAVDGDFLVSAASHGIVGAFHDRVAITVGEGDRAIFGVIDGGPNSDIALDECLIAIGIELRRHALATVGTLSLRYTIAKNGLTIEP